MSIITTATRMWLTRSTKPFVFTDEYDKELNIIVSKILVCIYIFLFVNKSVPFAHIVKNCMMISNVMRI